MPIKIIVAPHRSTSSQGHTRSKYLPLDQVTGSSMVSSKVEWMWLWFSFYYKRYIYPELHNTFIIVFRMLIFGCLGFEFQAYNQIFNMFSFKYHIGFRYCVVLVLQCTAWCIAFAWVHLELACCLHSDWSSAKVLIDLISVHMRSLSCFSNIDRNSNALEGFHRQVKIWCMILYIYIYVYIYTYIHVYIYIHTVLGLELFESGSSFTSLRKMLYLLQAS